MISASPQPNTPNSPGATIRLAMQAAGASSAIAIAASGRSRHPARRSTIERSAMLLPVETRVRGPDPAAQLRAHLLGDAHRVDTVADDLRPDEDDQLGALSGFVVAADQLAKLAELIDQRNAAAAVLLTLADQSGEQNRLTARNRDRAFDAALRHGRRQATGATGRDIRDLLLDIEQDVAVGVDARHHAQDHAGV